MRLRVYISVGSSDSLSRIFVRDKIENFAADYNSTPCGVVVAVAVAAVAVAVPPIWGANEKWDNFLTL